MTRYDDKNHYRIIYVIFFYDSLIISSHLTFGKYMACVDAW